MYQSKRNSFPARRPPADATERSNGNLALQQNSCAQQQGYSSANGQQNQATKAYVSTASNPTIPNIDNAFHTTGMTNKIIAYPMKKSADGSADTSAQ